MNKTEAGAKVFRGALADLLPTWEQLDDRLSALGLTRDVKTIYVSYTDPGRNLVAAVHPDPVTATIELALSLPADFAHERTYDATHLKWRTLPHAVRIAGVSDLDAELGVLIKAAAEYAPLATPRPSEDFETHRRRGRYSV